MSGASRRAGTVVGLGVLLASLAGGCVLGADEDASPLASVPDDLLSPTTSQATTTTEAPAEPSEFGLDLFWHINQGEGQRALIKVSRPRDTAADPTTALAELVAGPTEDELAAYAELGTLFPLVDELLAPTLTIAEGTATVTVSDEFELRVNDAAKIPVAEELVCTLTEFDSVTGVVVVDTEGPIPLTNRAAETITGRAERGDYGCDESISLADIEVDDESTEDES